MTSLIIITLALASGIVKCVANQWRKVREAEMEAALKQDMLNRGMSAQEIQMVLSAKGSKASLDVRRFSLLPREWRSSISTAS